MSAISSSSITLWLFILFGIVLIALIVAFALLLKQKKLLKTFMRGKKGDALEDTMKWLIEKHAQVDDTLKFHKQALEHIDERVERCVQTPSLTRFNAANNLGSEQSFSSSFLNENGDGFILSALTHRNHLGLYVKNIKKFEPEVTLTDEEKEVLGASKKYKKK